MCAPYNCARATCRWPMVLDGHIRRRAVEYNISRQIKLRIRQICNIEYENVPPNMETFGRCSYCSSKKNRKPNTDAKIATNFYAWNMRSAFVRNASEVSRTDVTFRL